MPQDNANRDKAGRDLDYVKRALERQHRFAKEYVPVWFAAAVGGYFAVTTFMKDLILQNRLAPEVREWTLDIGWVGLMIVVFAVIVRNQRQRKRAGQADCHARPSGREIWHLVGPWIVFIAGVVAVKFTGDALGLDRDTLRPLLLILTAVSFTLIGVSTLQVVFWMGIGIAIGAVPLIAGGMAYPYTFLGLAIFAGLVFGAWRDQRAYG